MSLSSILCKECDHLNIVSWMPATRVDPGCWERDLTCENCEADLDSEDAEPVDIEELRWANHPDV